MKRKEEINEKLIDILLKKAEGFHYEEEQYEYERSKAEKKTNLRFENLNFFDICDRGQSDSNACDDMMVLANETKKSKGCEGLVLVKKKVTSHYIPPDMLAVKILLEIFGKEELSDIEKMTDDELVKFKEKILKELKDEN